MNNYFARLPDEIDYQTVLINSFSLHLLFLQEWIYFTLLKFHDLRELLTLLTNNANKLLEQRVEPHRDVQNLHMWNEVKKVEKREERGRTKWKERKI